MMTPSSETAVRVLHIITTFSVGGATENTLLSVEGLRRHGYDAWILSGSPNASEGDLFAMAEANGVRVELLPSLVRNIHPWNDLVAFLALIRILRRERVDIVHTHSSKAGVLGRLAAFIARTPLVVHTIHGLPFHDYQPRWIYHVFRLAEVVCTAVSDRVITVTDTIREKALKAGVGRREQYVTVRSGFEVQTFEEAATRASTVRTAFGLQPTDVVVGKVARFSALKGHQYLLDAIPEVLQAVPQAKFLFIGGGELEDAFKEQARSRGIDKVTVFAGLQPVERMAECLAAIDVVVHTSLLEGLARVLPQALAVGRPVVSFDIDGAHEVVIPGRTGQLVDPRRPGQLAGILVQLLTNPEQRRAMGKAGAELVRSQWTTEAMVAGIDDVYRGLLQRRQLDSNGAPS
jgi:glycosyltransferase involved in cell wall biosynthesis